MPQRIGRIVNSEVGDLMFIADTALRRKIEDAIEMISVLYLLEKQEHLPQVFLKENRRIIILYSAAIIEAILLYVVKKKRWTIERTSYKNVSALPNNYQLDSKSTLVVAKQVQETRSEKELMLDVVLRTCLEKGVINLHLKPKIEKAKNVRNTFHLSKSRKGLNCTLSSANQSFDAVLETIMQSRKFLK